MFAPPCGAKLTSLCLDRRTQRVRCTVLAMDWPRRHYLAAVEREKSAPASKSNKGVDFVCPAKEWGELKVCRRPPEKKGIDTVQRRGGLAFRISF